jgi:Mg2+ and Co2+ transporter CorA
MTRNVWTHLVDPSAEELSSVVPEDLHPTAHERLTRSLGFEEIVFPRLDSDDQYLFGEFAYPVWEITSTTRDEDTDILNYNLGTISIRVMFNFDQFVTILRTPDDLPASVSLPDLGSIESTAKNASSGNHFVSLMTFVAQSTQVLLDDLFAETEKLEEVFITGEQPDSNCRKKISHLRSMYLELQTMVEPTLRLVESIIRDELDLTTKNEAGKVTREIFPREIEIYLIDVRSRLRHDLLRTQFGLEEVVTLSANLSDHLDRMTARHGNRLSAIVSIMLLPTFVVGLYGMNIDAGYFPEFGWINGYLFAWVLIGGLTLGQIILFRKWKWL